MEVILVSLILSLLYQFVALRDSFLLNEGGEDGEEEKMRGITKEHPLILYALSSFLSFYHLHKATETLGVS